ncbi:MAG: M48 family metalloprotease [Vicinamibacterales bacterium]|jgi:predicted Zn-dependent protease|nr:M48 family metalloprotease [Vicinamibacterales bacterium]MDP6607969.1 M48 family metalloprotease [Vicinamibacterales bacterium]HAK57168.1 hypothetical protein [Acidobacteriota bacterium]|tara:strand:+ start:2135 stop:3478 length:1344 start_codon:yes stop_codon:yes gene_type:complete
MRDRLLLLGAVLLAVPGWATAQTVIEPPETKYSIEEDVAIGEEAAEQVRQQLPALENDAVEYYVTRLGERLVEAIPSTFVHPEFAYTFEVVDEDGINAFALPGGPMFLHRGMLESALTEGGIAGVMAHEISHVALRHGTAQATRGEKFQWGALAGTIAGAIIGGTAGRAVMEGTSFGLGAFFLKYGREFEQQADLLGARIMATAGYDPRELAAMFELIEQQNRTGAPEWLSSHPNPGNRSEYIAAEAELLTIDDPVTDTREFERIRASLSGEVPPVTAEGAAGGTRPERPDTDTQYYEVAGVYAVDVPTNWIELPGAEAVTFSPEGGHIRTRNQSSFSHGVQIGMAERAGGNLAQAHAAFIESLTAGNPQLQATGGAAQQYLAGRRAYLTTFTNFSEATGWRETVMISTTILPDGRLLYLIAVSPEDEYADYVQTFGELTRSVRLLP